MHNLARVWIVGCLATASTTASTVFNAVLAVNTTSDDFLSPVLRVLLFVGLGFSFLGSLALVYFTAFYVRNVKSRYLHLRSAIWSAFGLGVGIGTMATGIPLVTLIWLVSDQTDLPAQTQGINPMTWVAAWFGCCGASIVTQATLFVILGLWIKQQTKQLHSTARLDIDWGTRIPAPPPDEMDLVPDEHRSFHSRDTTLADLPRTPVKRPESVSRLPGLPRPPAANSRTHLITYSLSAKSSIEMAFPAGEARVVDSAFDRWDTSSVHSEMRAAMGSSPPTQRGLETIPGSRPESPEDDAIDGPCLPSSPEQRPSSSPQALTADTATALGDWSSSPTRYAATSSPPSSPPNFSRPTSKQKNQAMSAPVESPLQGTIHPLFRASSPHPPPIATSGTVITASPMANQPITPRTLANLRSHNKSSSTVSVPSAKPVGHWRAMPSISQHSTRRPSTAGSQGPGSLSLGSPGPSIVDDDELPPIIPGFVLSAGQRSSMLGYASRKRIKSRRSSQFSARQEA